MPPPTPLPIDTAPLASRAAAERPTDSGPNANAERLLLWIGGALVLLAGLSLAWRPAAALQLRPLTEDGFFSLAVARQLAMGHGLSIDGVHWVNGFQPLFTLLCAVPFALAGGDRAGGLRGVLVLHTLVLASGAWACGLLARDAVASPGRRRLRQTLGTAGYLFSPLVFLTTFNGLETGAVLALLAWTWRYWQLTGGQNLRQLGVTGELLGLLVLTRIDTALLVVVVTVGVFAQRNQPWPRRLQRAAAIAVPAGVVSAPWWLYNYLGFGSLMPTSGRALTAVGVTLERTLTMLQAVQMSVLPLTYAGRWESFWLLPARLVLLVLVVVGVGRARRLAAPAESAKPYPAFTVDFSMWIAVTLVLFAGYYWYTSSALWFYGRYLSAIAVPMTVYSAIALSSLDGWLARLRAVGVTAVGLALLVAVWRLHTSPDFAAAAYVGDQLAVVQQFVPPDEDVASGQTGTLGFFRDRVINLDGKVNPDALRSRSDIPGYLRRTHVRWFCDWQHFAERYLGNPPARHGWELVARKGAFMLYRRVEP